MSRAKNISGNAEKGKTCSTCKHGQSTTATPSGQTRECRAGRPGAYPNVYYGTVRFPWVQDGETCGDWTPRVLEIGRGPGRVIPWDTLFRKPPPAS